MIYGFCFLSCSLVVVRKIDGVEAGHAWKDEKPLLRRGGRTCSQLKKPEIFCVRNNADRKAMQSSCNTRVLTKAWSRRPGFFLTVGRMNKIC